MADSPALDLSFAPGPDAGRVRDLVIAALDDHEPLAIHEDDDADRWVVHFRTASGRDSAARAVDALALPGIAAVTAVDVPDEDWARRSQAHLTSVRVGRLTIAPPWDIPSDAGDVIVIEPSMGFGTGHHQTTRLCLRLLQDLDLAGASVLDVGTGSGVLAIAALRLGASPVTGMDYDGDALQNARENAERNGVADRVRFLEADLATVGEAAASVVLANLTGAVIQAHAATLVDLVEPGGRLILSGFSPAELDEVAGAVGIDPAVTATEGDWAAARFDR